MLRVAEAELTVAALLLVVAPSGFVTCFIDPQTSAVRDSVSDSESIGSFPFNFFEPLGRPRPLLAIEPFVALLFFFAMVGFETSF